MNKTRAIVVALFIIICTAVLYYGGLFRSNNQKTNDFEWTPQSLPDLEFTKLNGETARLSDFKDKVILLNFWASWCAPCIKEFPSMVKLVQENKGKVVLVAISHDSSRSKIETFLKKYSGQLANKNDPNIIIAWDKNQRLATDTFSVLKLPETIIVDKKMRMVSKIVGAVDWYGSEMRNRIQKLTIEIE